MKLLTNFIIGLLGLVILGGIIFFGYQFYDRLHAPAASPFKVIPSNAALIIKVNKPMQFWQESRTSNKLWQQLFTIPTVAGLKEEISNLDSTIRKNQKIIGLIRSNPLVIVFAPTFAENYDLLFIMNVDGGDAEDRIAEFIEKGWLGQTRIEKNSYAGSTLYSLFVRNDKKPIYFTVRDKLFIASKEPLLVKQSVDRLSLNIASEEDKQFKEVYSSSGKNVSANVFIHYPVIAPFVNTLMNAGPLVDFLQVANFASWSELDLIQKQDEWLVSGYSVCDEEKNQYLSIFKGQSPQKISMTSVIPENTLYFSWIGIGDPVLIRQNLIISKNQSSTYFSGDLHLSKFEQDHSLDFSTYFLPWLGNEIGTFKIFANDEKSETLTFGVLKMNDLEVADSCLQALIKIGSKQKAPYTYKSRKIYNLSIPGLLPYVWGNFYDKVDGAYFTYYGDYVLFGKNEASIQKLIDQINSGNTIDKNESYISFSGNHTDETNLYFFFNSAIAFNDLQSVLSEKIRQEIMSSKDSLIKFSAFGVQITSKEDAFLTNVFIHFNQTRPGKGPLVWQTSLENAISGRPMVFTPPMTGKPIVVVHDDKNILYGVNTDGTIQWKLQLPGKPMGDVQAIPTPNLDSLIFIVNTPYHLCIVDQNGLFINNSPHNLPAVASSPCLLSENITHGKTVILIPLNDMRIHAFDLLGKQLPTWHPPIVSATIVKPLQEFLIKGKIYFTGSTSNGNQVIFNDKGKVFPKSQNSIKCSSLSPFFLNKTNNKGEFVTTSTDGALTYLSIKGRYSQVKFNNFTSGHLFYYFDFNGDKLNEFIYFDANKLYCYNKFKKLLFEYSFPPFTEKPFMLKDSDGKLQLGIVSPKTGDIYLFGKNGMVNLDPEIRGKTPFQIIKFADETTTSLFIGEEKFLKKFRLTKK